jgi:hypothetical protein
VSKCGLSGDRRTPGAALLHGLQESFCAVPVRREALRSTICYRACVKKCTCPSLHFRTGASPTVRRLLVAPDVRRLLCIQSELDDLSPAVLRLGKSMPHCV